MVVAAGALQADAEKKLSDFLGPRQRISQPTIEPGRRIAVIAATRGQDAANELVFRHVVENGLPNPFMILYRADLADETLVAATPIGPLYCPTAGKLRPLLPTLDTF